MRDRSLKGRKIRGRNWTNPPKRVPDVELDNTLSVTQWNTELLRVTDKAASSEFPQTKAEWQARTEQYGLADSTSVCQAQDKSSNAMSVQLNKNNEEERKNEPNLFRSTVAASW